MDECTPAALSHRESYKKHLTHMANVQQAKALSSIQKSFAKDCEDQMQRHNHEALQLRRKLKKLQQDKTYYKDNTFNQDDEAGPSGGSQAVSAKGRKSVVGLMGKRSTSASEYEDEDDLLPEASKPKESTRGARNPNAAVSDKWQDSLRKVAMLEEAILHLKHAHMVKDTSMLPTESKFNALLNPDKPATSKQTDQEKAEKQKADKEKTDHMKSLQALTRRTSESQPHAFRRASLPTRRSSGAENVGIDPATPTRAPKLRPKSFSVDEYSTRRGSTGERRMSEGRRGSTGERRMSEGRRGSAGQGSAKSAPTVDVAPRGSDSGSKQHPVTRKSSSSSRGSRKVSLDEHIPTVIPESTDETKGPDRSPRDSITPGTSDQQPSGRGRPSTGRVSLTVEDAHSPPLVRRGSFSRRSSSNLSSSNLSRSNLSRSNLSRTSLSRSSLSRSHLGRRSSRRMSELNGMDKELLAKYAELIQKCLNEADPQKESPTIPGVVPKIRDNTTGVPGAAAKRSQRRRIMQLEDMLNALPSYKKENKHDLTPAQVLACSYLRLSKNNVVDCKRAIRMKGEDPGVHVHMTQEEAEEYFVLKDRLLHIDDELMVKMEEPEFKLQIDFDDGDEDTTDN